MEDMLIDPEEMRDTARTALSRLDAWMRGDAAAEEVAAFRDELGIDFPLLLDPEADVQRLYRVLGYPTTFFIDEEGTIRFRHIGLMSGGQLDEYLKQMGLTA